MTDVQSWIGVTIHLYNESVVSGVLKAINVELALIPLICRSKHGRCDVPPVLSSTVIWSPIPQPKEIGREEAIF